MQVYCDIGMDNMTTKLNPSVITDDMMYEGADLSGAFVPTAEIDAWASDNKRQILKHHEEMMERSMWEKIRQTAKTNIALQAALDHVIMIYKLSKEYKDGI